MSSSENDSEDDFKPSGSRAKGSKRKKSQKKRPCGKKAKEDIIDPSLCFYCHTNDDDVKVHENQPEGAMEEFEALFKPEIQNSLLTDPDDEYDERLQLRATQITCYCEAGHIVSFDSDMLEARNQTIKFDGYIKPITDDSPSAETGVPVKEAVIVEWWISGYGDGEKVTLGFSTEQAHYYVNAPSPIYAPFFKRIKERGVLSKAVVDVLSDAHDEGNDLSYQDLISKLEKIKVDDDIDALNSEMLINNSQFVLSQVSSYEEAGDEDEERYMMQSQCIRDLLDLAGEQTKKSKSKGHVRLNRQGTKKKSKTTQSLATTTALIRGVFNDYFGAQIDASENGMKPKTIRKWKCQQCENCQKDDCGKCRNCLDMIKFGGTGKSKQGCIERICNEMIEKNVDNVVSDDENEEDSKENIDKNIAIKGQHNIKNFTIKLERLSVTQKTMTTHLGVTYPEKPLGQIKAKFIHNIVQVGGRTWKSGDFAMLDKEIVQLVYFYQKDRRHKAHVKNFVQGSKTILEETCDSKQIFEVEACLTIDTTSLDFPIEVKFWPIPKDWEMNGGKDVTDEPPIDVKSSKSFYYRQKYDHSTARFEDAQELTIDFLKKIESQEMLCPICDIKDKKNVEGKTKLFHAYTKYDDETGEAFTDKKYWKKFIGRNGVSFGLQDAVFIKPKNQVNKDKKSKDKDDIEEYDQKRYPEKYRKNKHEKGSNEFTQPPFDIGMIEEIRSNPEGQNVRLQIRLFYRPNQVKDKTKARAQDLNYVYYVKGRGSTKTIDVDDIFGKCYLVSEQTLGSVKSWSQAGEYRFYFNKAYDKDTKEITELPIELENFGGKSKGKGKGKSSLKGESTSTDTGALPRIPQKLKCLDIFAGVGGLSEGFHQAYGGFETRWAIECQEEAAIAFKKNHPDCSVFADDCNLLLKKVIEAESQGKAAEHQSVRVAKLQQLPRKGEVDVLAGGPPCQGFSGMNRFNEGEYSTFKNSLIASYLSYLEFYRPKFFILENVRNFASFKSSIILKLCLRALNKMGYQCTFGILQAGHYGVPQTRRRFILLAAAPGYTLPSYPEPLHTFQKTSLSVTINNTKYESNCQWDEFAPYRTIDISDCMSDLPAIRNGQQELSMNYQSDPLSPYQRLMRESDPKQVQDHICKKMPPLDEKRFELIPTNGGSDWRDLPNDVLRLSDGSYTKILLYKYNDIVQGKNPVTGDLRGVCNCATSKTKAKCSQDKQIDTLIPWCLPHTGNRHNHWAGLYGRLAWDGFFSTTVTNPQPMGKQGRVLHPDQHRVVSVRECARSQGFPDGYIFEGHIIDKHRQVGNAVPPPMGRAIGLEILKAYAKSAKKNEMKKEPVEEMSV